MAADNEVLWVVEAINAAAVVVRSYVFRTRSAGRDFGVAMNAKSKKLHYSRPRRAAWGPEQ